MVTHSGALPMHVSMFHVIFYSNGSADYFENKNGSNLRFQKGKLLGLTNVNFWLLEHIRCSIRMSLLKDLKIAVVLVNSSCRIEYGLCLDCIPYPSTKMLAHRRQTAKQPMKSTSETLSYIQNIRASVPTTISVMCCDLFGYVSIRAHILIYHLLFLYKIFI